jgi:hypothetical protein
MHRPPSFAQRGIQSLQLCPIFHGVPKHELAQLFAHMQREHFHRNDVIFNEVDHKSPVYEEEESVYNIQDTV